MLQYVIIGIIVIFIARLFYLQIIDKDYQQLAKSNVLRQITVFRRADWCMTGMENSSLTTRRNMTVGGTRAGERHRHYWLL